ncbi:MAG: hypothetical protein KC877_02350 [Candidatus Kaiserbacteria bacterium]|nr:hypothetical protein [Candidatus Kaiserbacteria bacterium]MCB9816088.1 hypothetical protein [Candidatus Nomurabacteria bacterium]
MVGTEVYNVAQELRISNDLKAQAMNIDITPIREKYPAFGLEDKSE